MKPMVGGRGVRFTAHTWAGDLHVGVMRANLTSQGQRESRE